MLDEPEIRDLTLEDIYDKDGLIECLQQLAPVELSKGILEDLYYDRQHTGLRTVVAASGDLILGTATLIIEQKIIHNGGKVGKIEDVCVHPDYHGVGFGKLLVRHLIALAREAKCYKVILSCSSKNIEFYKKLGFRPYENTMRLDL